jgi:hypothetical protein
MNLHVVGPDPDGSQNAVLHCCLQDPEIDGLSVPCAAGRWNVVDAPAVQYQYGGLLA